MRDSGGIGEGQEHWVQGRKINGLSPGYAELLLGV